MDIPLYKYTSPVLPTVTIQKDSFWGHRIKCIRTQTVPAIIHNINTTGRLSALKWRSGDPKIPAHPFWDSDVFKMVEACCYLLVKEEDAFMRRWVDESVEIIRAAQGEDGYLNSYFTILMPEKRFTNIRDFHELYQLGHLCEAAVAHHLLTKTTTLVDVAMRYVRLVGSHFGPTQRLKGYPGHEELEIGLMRLYQLTNDQECLSLAHFFIFERGKTYGDEGKNFFDDEMAARGGDPSAYFSPEFRPHYERPRDYAYHQAHAPLVEQQTIEGHCVRAMYYLIGTAIYVYEMQDTETLKSLQRLFANTTRRKMYVTGGIGSVERSEGFGPDFLLPDQAEGGCAYAETCASFALIVLCHRLLLIELKGEYGDVMERALYNAVLGAVSADGKSFYYENPLAVLDGTPRERSSWFDVACCPPNVVKLFGLLPQLIWSQSKDEKIVAVHLHISSVFETMIEGKDVRIVMESAFPWDGDARITIQSAAPTDFVLAVRLPKWAEKTFEISVADASVRDGYIFLPSQSYSGTESITMSFPCTSRKIFAHPLTRKDEVAIARGPLIYCAESHDNPDINLEILGFQAGFTVFQVFEHSEIGGVKGVKRLIADGLTKDMRKWEESGELYTDEEGDVGWGREKEAVMFIPWFLRCNRGREGGSGMRLWFKRISEVS